MKFEQGYTHSFDRFFEFEGETFDRKELIGRHGLVSPLKAKELGIPYKRTLQITVEGFPQEEYDNIIFVYPKGLRSGPLLPGPITAYIDSDVEVATPQDMEKNMAFGAYYHFMKSMRLDL